MNNDGINNKKRKNKKINIVIILLLVVIVIVGVVLLFNRLLDSKKNDENKENENLQTEASTIVPTPTIEPTSKYQIFNTISNKRPYAISINNTNVAVKVQEGLNKAYIVYELPTEFHTSRLLALFKDVEELTVGTIRSCRHNFMDYAHDNDAILVCYGWSHYAKDELEAGGTDFMNGNEKKWASAFWRNNPEKLAWEHTAYTSLEKIIDYTTKNNYRLTSDSAQLLNYSTEEIDLSSMEGNTNATDITIPYGGTTTRFTYDKKTKMYTRIVNGKTYKDHNTKEAYTTKNIIIVKISHTMMPDNYYWDLKTTGTGNGYYITNGKSVPITWKKDSRNGKSKYYLTNGDELVVNDGRTYIEVNTKSKTVTIK